MPAYQPITPEKFANKHWSENDNYQFTSKDSVCPLVAEELVKIIFNLPAAFIKKGDQFKLVSVQGLDPQTNLCIDSDGSWQVGYIPSRYRSHPFTLIKSKDDKLVLCADLESSQFSEAGDGEPLFDEAKQPTESLNKIMGFLKRREIAKQKTQQICAALEKFDLIQPAKFRMTGEKSISKSFYTIDESALNALTPEALTELRDMGALSVAYSQLLSTHQFQKLVKLRKIRAEASEIAATRKDNMPVELDLDFLHNHGNISFGEL